MLANILGRLRIFSLSAAHVEGGVQALKGGGGGGGGGSESMSKRRRGERRHQHGGNSSWSEASRRLQVLLFPACWQSNRRATSLPSRRRCCSCPPEQIRIGKTPIPRVHCSRDSLTELYPIANLGLTGFWADCSAARLCSRWPEAAILRDSN